MDELKNKNRRELQLDVISSLLIVAMVVVVGILLYIVSSYGLQLPSSMPLSSYYDRILLGGFVLVVVAYLWDQRARLRAQVDRAIAETENAREELENTVRYLAFSHNAASRLGAEGVAEAMRLVLREASELFRTDAAAVLGEEEEHVYIADGVPAAEAERALARVTAYAAGKDTPFHIESLGSARGQAIAVPLRVKHDLRYVLALWKQDEAFPPDQLDALGLMGRMVELALEREESLKEAHDQLEGTLRVLQYLVADKRPDYSRHAGEVARLAASIGHKMGLASQVRKELRLAGLVHDVGMIAVRGGVGDAGQPLTADEWLAVRQHPSQGGEIARAANLGPMVQDAVAGHHERMDGSGYPLGLRSTMIPVEARIIAVCEVYDSMMHRSYHDVDHRPEDAMGELEQGAGTLYDRTVVTALRAVVAEDEARAAAPAEPQPSA